MNKYFNILILILILISGCGTPVSETLISTATVPAPTQTEMPTSTKTPDPMAGAPEGTTGINSQGEWIKTVTENEHMYEYVFNAELEQYVREIASFHLGDYPYENFIPYKIFITENTPDERYLYKMTHVDDMPGGIGSYPNGRTEPMPIKASFIHILREQYFLNDPREISDNEKQEVIYNEMLGQGAPGHEQAYLPIILSNGQEARVKLSQTTGIILTIMDKDTLFKLGGDRVSAWSYSGVPFYSEVYGVDANGNMLARLALDGSWNDSFLWEHTDQLEKYRNTGEIIRVALFSIPANLAEHKDQIEQGVTDFAITLGHESTWMQPLGGTTIDLEIELVPAVQP